MKTKEIREACEGVEHAAAQAADEAALVQALEMRAEVERKLELAQLAWATLFAICLGAALAGGTFLKAGTTRTDTELLAAGAVLLIVCVPLAVLSAARFAMLARASSGMRKALREPIEAALEVQGRKPEEPTLGLRVIQAAIFAVVAIAALLVMAQAVANGTAQVDRLFAMF